MNATVTLGGVVLSPASISNTPVRIGTVQNYNSGKRQEYYRQTKRATALTFACTEAEALSIETLSRSSTVLSYTDEFSRTYNVRPVSFASDISANVNVTKPIFVVTLQIEEVG